MKKLIAYMMLAFMACGGAMADIKPSEKNRPEKRKLEPSKKPEPKPIQPKKLQPSKGIR